MLGNFTYSNPTKLYFGEDSLKSLNEELPKYGERVLLVYGGGSIKKNGIYDQALVMFIIVLIITLIQWRGQQKWVNY